jgi:hypothetical protein
MKIIFTVTRKPNGTYRISHGAMIIADNLTAEEVMYNIFESDDEAEFEFVK